MKILFSVENFDSMWGGYRRLAEQRIFLSGGSIFGNVWFLMCVIVCARLIASSFYRVGPFIALPLTTRCLLVDAKEC